MKRAPIDLSDLDFLEYGDRTLIALAMTSEGRKVSTQYVSEICKGKHINGPVARDVLRKAFELAQKRKGKLPMHVVKS